MAKKTIFRSAFSVIVLLMAISTTVFAQTPFANNRLIVKYRGQSSLNVLCKQSAASASMKVTKLDEKYHCVSHRKLFSSGKAVNKNSSVSDIGIINFSGPVDILNAAEEYMATGAFEYVEPDYKLNSQSANAAVSDPFYSLQWGISNAGNVQFNGKTIPAKADADIDLDDAWEITKGDSSVIVALLDGGLKMASPEFSGRIWTNKNEIPANGIDDDNNGYVDDYQGNDFGNSDTSVEDLLGHGTCVGSVIAANPNNGIGIAGVDSKCKIMVCKIRDDTGMAYNSYSAIGIIYAVQNGASVINYSLGKYEYSDIMAEAIDYAFDNNVLMVAGSGNEGKDTVYFPASLQKVLSVGSTDPDDCRSKSFLGLDSCGSNYGIGINNGVKEQNVLDVVAPGNYIASVKLGDPNTLFVSSGTSLSTAFVTGIASLLKSVKKDLTPEQITQIITSTADDQVGDPSEDTPGYDKYYGYGRVNARKALDALNISVRKTLTSQHKTGVWVSVNSSNRILFDSHGSDLNSVRITALNGAAVKSRIRRIDNCHIVADVENRSNRILAYSALTKNGRVDGRISLVR